MSQQDAKRKIQALLSLADNSPFPGEVASAMAAVERLKVHLKRKGKNR